MRAASRSTAWQRVAQEVLLVEQVLGRVAGDGELAAQREAGAGRPRAVERVGDRALVRGDVADRRVELAEREAQRGHERIIEPAGRAPRAPASVALRERAGSGSASPSLSRPKHSRPR